MRRGRFRREARLGAGAQGEVVAAFDTWRDVPVVLKRLSGSAAPRAELVALRHVRHPGLVEAFGLWRDGEETFLVEERIDGPPLVDWAAGRTAEEIAAAVAPAAHALAHLHARGLLHGDVAPQNILVREGGAVLIDLGLSRAIGSRASAGTPGFVAPEVLAAEAAGGAADVFGLAATLCAALTGEARPSWAAPSAAAVRPRELGELLTACLRPSPGSRPSALEVARRLAAQGGVAPSTLDRPALTLPLCGRDDEVRAFVAWLEAGKGPWLVAGAPGMGKSRYLTACREQAELRGYLVLETAGDRPRGLAALVGQALDLVDADGTLVREHGAALAAFVDHPALAAFGARPASAREQAAAAVLALDLVHRERQTLIVCDDALAADEPLGAALAIWRERDDAAGARLVAANERFAGAAGVELGPLSAAGIGELLGVAFAEPRPAAESAHLINAVGGRPADLVAALGELAQRGGTVFDLDGRTAAAAPRLPPALAPLAACADELPATVVQGLIAEDPAAAGALGGRPGGAAPRR